MRIPFYDGRKLFEVYHSMGAAATLEKVMKWAKKNMPNPQTGGSVAGITAVSKNGLDLFEKSNFVSGRRR